jgi:iron complex outermembrane receptor protein
MKKTKTTLLTLFFQLLIVIAFSQNMNGIIKGSVKDETGKSLPSATIILRGTTFSTITDNLGVFNFENLTPGKYFIFISSIGYESKTIEVMVKEGSVENIQVVLNSISGQLQTVEVIGRNTNGYKADYSFAATKIAIPITEIPNTVSTITQQLIRDRQAVRFDDVARNANVRVTNNGRSVVIRGFQNSTRLVNGLRTLSENYRFSAISPVVESFEVVKGPSSSMFGNMSPGGVVNIVTKKPLAEKKQSVSFSAGSFNTLRGDLDFTGKVTDDGTVLYRLNMFGQLSDTWYRNMKDNAFTIAPSFSFLPAPGTRFNFDLNYTNLVTMENDGLFPFKGKTIDETPIDFSVLQVGDRNKTQTTSANFSLAQKLSSKVSFNVSYLKDFLTWDDKRHFPELYLGNGAWSDGDSSVSLAYSEWNTKMNADNITAYFTANFNTGKIKHRSLIGYDYNVSLFNWGTFRFTTSPIGSLNVYDPAKSPAFDGTTYSLAAYTYDRENKSRNYANGVYFQDQLSISEKIKVLLGLRYESYTFRLAYQTPSENTVGQKAWLPKIGITYNLPSLTHVYASYVTGFEPVSANALRFGTAEGGGTLKPEYSNQVEIGVKQELFNKKLLVTLAAYQIKKINVTQLTNPLVPNLNDRIWRQLGEVSSKGIEFEMNGQVSNAFSINATYNYNDAKISKDLKPENVGQKLGLAPEHQGNIWAKYELQNTVYFKGLGIAGGVSFSSKTPMQQAPTITTPGYSVLDAALSYRINKVSLDLNINNITNKRYYTGAVRVRERYYTGAPRNIMFRVGYTL